MKHTEGRSERGNRGVIIPFIHSFTPLFNGLNSVSPPPVEREKLQMGGVEKGPFALCP